MTNRRIRSNKYSAVHKWIQNHYGRADHCEKDPSHVSSVYEWANKDHKYTRDLTCWMQLCPKCHREYDKRQYIFRRANKNNETSGIKGVYPSGKRWMARVKVNYKNLYLGLFDTIQEAETMVRNIERKIYAEEK